MGGGEGERSLWDIVHVWACMTYIARLYQGTDISDLVVILQVVQYNVITVDANLLWRGVLGGKGIFQGPTPLYDTLK